MKENTSRVSDFPFIRFPAAFVKLPCFKKLPVDAKYLYALLLDRLNLSISNKWKDDNGEPYVLYSIESMMNHVGCSKTKAIRMMDTLEEWGLIRKVKQGFGKPNRIYVLDPVLLDRYQNDTALSTSESTDQSIYDTGFKTDPVGNDTALSTDQSDSETALSTDQSAYDTTADQSSSDTSPVLTPKKSIFETQEVSKLDPNQTNYNQTNYNQTEQEKKTPALTDGVMNQKAKELLCKTCDVSLVDKAASLLYELVATPSRYARIDNTLTSGYTLSQQLTNISVEQIQSALHRFSAEQYSKAEERDYLMTALYYASKENRTA